VISESQASQRIIIYRFDIVATAYLYSR